MSQESSRAEAMCVVCGTGEPLKEVPGFKNLLRITSDCRPFKAGGYLGVCGQCGAVQKRVDANWLGEIGGIYAQYEAYYQSGGDEQIVMDRETGLPRRRSDVLLEKLSRHRDWPREMDALDVGCGNGATLRAMSNVQAAWRLYGFELGSGALTHLQEISQFQQLYTGAIENIQREFSLVTMIHSLEHFPSPHEALTSLSGCVGKGQLFIEVCNVEDNPFDILVADHLMHFSPNSLRRLLQRAGYSVSSVATDWVTKEISALAKCAVLEDELLPQVDVDAMYERIIRYVSWLNQLVANAQACAASGKGFGIFGTSIAATWLAQQMDEKLTFFVDEDSSRVGKEHMGRPILHPSQLATDATVYLALAPYVAQRIVQRLSDLRITWVMPPD
ncbi:MAG: hypothetical protein JWL63_528 [Rhodocyclales bacterium]|nr:hypothetical protein [Rhodocyclales bacterium]